MFQEIFHCSPKSVGIVAELADCRVAVSAKQSAHNAGFMAMVYTWPSFQQGEINFANGALAVLCGNHLLVLLMCNFVNVLQVVLQKALSSTLTVVVALIYRRQRTAFTFFVRFIIRAFCRVYALFTRATIAGFSIAPFMEFSSRLVGVALWAKDSFRYDVSSGHVVYASIVSNVTRLAQKFTAFVRAVSIIPQKAIQLIQFNQLCACVMAAPPHSPVRQH